MGKKVEAHFSETYHVSYQIKRTREGMSEDSVDDEVVEVKLLRKNIFKTLECAQEYAKWYKDQFEPFLFNAMSWPLLRWDFATILDEIAERTAGRVEIWLRHKGDTAHEDSDGIGLNSGDELLYVIEEGKVEGPLMQSSFI